MNYIFCSSCGSKIEYNLSKPNFCVKCGFNLGFKKESSAKKNDFVESNDEFLEEDETPCDSVPSIRKLQVDVENDIENNSFSFGSLFGKDSKKTFVGRNRKSLEDFVNDRR
jgi:hypothetical protein